MSGIAGIIHFDGAPVAVGTLEKMTACMRHRGPDGISHWHGGGISLGHCMLRTTPESLQEFLPLANEDQSLVLVVDGRVDNWLELRARLLGVGAQLRTRADAELILRAYEHWGEGCLQHIEGDFALAIWNSTQKTLFCARDRMGMKPLFYYSNDNSLVFASDLAALMEVPAVPRLPNDDMLNDFLALKWNSRTETLWKHVLRLPAAHQLRFSQLKAGLKAELKEYWQPDLYSPLRYRRDEEYIEHYREVLADSVCRLSRTHLPLACEVSGGLDSAGVTGMAEHLLRTRRLHAASIEAYTLTGLGDKDADELAYAKNLARHWGVQLHEIDAVVPPLAWFSSSSQQLQDLPPYPNSAMWPNFYAKVVANGSRVALNGYGGDDWLWGTRTYYAEELAAGNWSALSDCLQADIAAHGLRTAVFWLLRHGAFVLLPPAVQQRVVAVVRKLRGHKSLEDRLHWLTPAVRDSVERRTRLARFSKVPMAGQLVLMKQVQDGYHASAVQEVERMYASQGLEGRSPLYTAKLVQFMFSTPERLRMRGDSHKFIHVQATRDLVPQSVFQRRTKGDYSIVFKQRLQDMHVLLGALAPDALAGKLERAGVADLLRIYSEQGPVDKVHWHLWNIYGCYTFMNNVHRSAKSA